MQIEEFQRILQCGLGRIILYPQEHDSTPYQEYILDACLHNHVYDPQSEGKKTQSLYKIIHLSHKESFYRETILPSQPLRRECPLSEILRRKDLPDTRGFSR